MNFLVEKSLPTFLTISLDKTVVEILLKLYVHLMTSYGYGYFAFQKDWKERKIVPIYTAFSNAGEHYSSTSGGYFLQEKLEQTWT